MKSFCTQCRAAGHVNVNVRGADPAEVAPVGVMLESTTTLDHVTASNAP